jgi:hypothetical protein
MSNITSNTQELEYLCQLLGHEKEDLSDIGESDQWKPWMEKLYDRLSEAESTSRVKKKPTAAQREAAKQVRALASKAGVAVTIEFE